MFRSLGEKIPMSDTDSDVYCCEVWYIFAQCISVLFCLIYVTAIQDTVFVHLHAYTLCPEKKWTPK